MVTRKRQAAMRRIEIVGDATLILGDCLEIMLELDPVQSIITDPPFEMEAHGYQPRSGKTGIRNGELDFDPITAEQRRFLPAWARKNCSGWLLAFCQAESLHLWREEFGASGCVYKRACVWVKVGGMPQWSGDRPGMGYETIAAAWCGGGKSRWNGGGRTGVFRHGIRGEATREHQTQKPDSLMIELVQLFTDPGDVVFDPFMGSGTTGVACLRTGRKFIGIELEEKYFDAALRRIRNEHERGDFLR